MKRTFQLVLFVTLVIASQFFLVAFLKRERKSLTQSPSSNLSSLDVATDPPSHERETVQMAAVNVAENAENPRTRVQKRRMRNANVLSNSQEAQLSKSNEMQSTDTDQTSSVTAHETSQIVNKPTARLPPLLPQCGHVLLFSAPRHGSTWLVDSVEKCRFRTRGKFKRAVANSELWVPNHKLLANVTVEQAVHHLQNECSVKMFPNVFFRAESEPFILNVKNIGIPMIILTRSLKNAYLSFRRAKQHQQWNRINVAVSDDNDDGDDDLDELDQGFVSFRNGREKHFSIVRETLARLDVKKVDTFAYEDIRNEEFIIAEHSGCYIHNCNFL